MFAPILAVVALGLAQTAGTPVVTSRDDPLSAYAGPVRLIEPADGRRINLDCRGSGAPVVILETGWGDTTLMWATIHDSLAEHTTTCAYDRAGLGFSDPRDGETTLAAIEADLAQVAEVAGRGEPVILVGHSKGGVFVRQFAAARPGRVAGLVLLDPGGPEKDVAYAAADPEGSRAAGVQLRALLEACVADARSGALRASPDDHPFCVAAPDPDWPPELQQADRAMQTGPAYAEARLAEFRIDGDALTATGLGDLPLTVLSSDEGLSRAIPVETRTRLIAARHQADASVAALSTRGVHRVIPNAGHMIADDQPQAVIDAVEQMILLSRTRGAGE